MGDRVFGRRTNLPRSCTPEGDFHRLLPRLTAAVPRRSLKFSPPRPSFVEPVTDGEHAASGSTDVRTANMAVKPKAGLRVHRITCVVCPQSMQKFLGVEGGPSGASCRWSSSGRFEYYQGWEITLYETITARAGIFYSLEPTKTHVRNGTSIFSFAFESEFRKSVRKRPNITYKVDVLDPASTTCKSPSNPE